MSKISYIRRINTYALAGMCFFVSTVSAQLTSSNLPIVVIDTHGQTILDEPKITADMGIIYHGEGLRNNLTDPFNSYTGKIGIEVRGSSSQMFPKKQYAVETRDALGNDLDVALLGMPLEADWVLSAPYTDKSLMRDALIFKMAASIGRYASRVKFCELVLNNQYMGVYVLFEKIKRGKSRVPISKMTTADTTGDALTGGYILKIDKIEGSETGGWQSSFPPYTGAGQRIYYQYHYPKPEDLVPPQATYIQKYIRDFETMMSGPNFADTSIGYPHALDVASFVDFFLLNELGRNVDAYRLSTFMYKDRDSKGGKLVMGPVWDFNLAFGNCDYYAAWGTTGYQFNYLTGDPSFLSGDGFQVPFWWKKLLSDAAFIDRLKKRWTELRKDQFSQTRLHASVDSMVTVLAEGQARNFVRWPILGQYVWPNWHVSQTYMEEINYMKNWITQRLAFMDSQLLETSSMDDAGEGVIADRLHLLQNYPNPFNPVTQISYIIPATRQGPALTNVRLAVYDLLGREVALLVHGQETAGEHTVQFDATSLSSGIYWYRLEAGGSARTMTMILVR